MTVAIGPDFASVDRDTADMQIVKTVSRFMGTRAVYGRSLNGSPYIDPTWDKYKDQLKLLKLKRIAYLFICFPQKGEAVPTPSPEAQAQAFINYVQLDPFMDYAPMMDVEETSDVLSAQEMFDWVLCVAVALRRHYGIWPGMYVSARVWGENLKHHPAGYLINCPLWLAKPWPKPVHSPAVLDGEPAWNPLLIPEFGDNQILYQYQGDATGYPGFNHNVDISRCRVMRKGERGTQVVWVQQRLGLALTDGIFGDGTEAAVKALQAKYSQTVDGIIGVDTWGLLMWSNPAPV